MSDEFADVLAANAAYADHFTLGDLTAPAATGLGVLTCIDSRIEPLRLLGLEPGDAKIFRNAGARVSEDALRSLVLAANLLDVRRIMVIAHTDCAMATVSDTELRQTLQERYPTANLGDLRFGVMNDQRATLERDVQRVRNAQLLPDDVTVGGFIYDVTTGLLEQVV